MHYSWLESIQKIHTSLHAREAIMDELHLQERYHHPVGARLLNLIHQASDLLPMGIVIDVNLERNIQTVISSVQGI